MESTNYRYGIYPIMEWVDLEYDKQESHEQSTGDHDNTHRDTQRAIQACEYLRHCRDHAAGLTEPEWWAMVCALALEHDAEKIIHEMSQGYPGYTEKETNKKIKEIKKCKTPVNF